MNNKLILALSVLFSLPAIGYSQTVSWATPPVYESLVSPIYPVKY
mgnify:CR=1 FL=1